MKRFALIIEASEVPGEGKLPGAVVDALNYQSWLLSPSGGAWKPEEIRVLNTPSVAQVKASILLAGKVDCFFAAFSGHGFHQGELDETKVCLRDGEITAGSLRGMADRCTVVVDACRKVMFDKLSEGVIKLSHEIRAGYHYADRDYRLDFERQLELAEKGSVFLYSCDLQEAAGESRLGGFFSRYLIETGVEFRQRNTEGKNWLPMDKAFSGAAALTTIKNPQQNPQFEPGRRRAHFPFGV